MRGFGEITYCVEKDFLALVGVAHSVGCHLPENQNVASSIPNHGTCLGCRPGPHLGVRERQPICVSLAH